MILTDYLGRSIDVRPERIEPELLALLDAVDDSCSATGTSTEQENLRCARSALKNRLYELIESMKSAKAGKAT